MSIIQDSKLGVDYLTVHSTFGSINGFINKDYPNVAQFLGIPFAEPPTGPRRWLPPVPKSPARSFDATRFGPSCPQWTGSTPSIYNSDVPELRIADETSEDCLSLCVWGPAGAARNPLKASLPVIVWITGGAFLVGGSTVPYQNPTPWVEDSQRHIVVSINYRLTIFGFPNAAGLDPRERNLGLLDQRLGLEWVHANIASFGGDPGRLTHFGQSAGGRSVDMHTFQHVERPLVCGLIMNSGTALQPLAEGDREGSHFSFVARALGFAGGDPAAELEFMRGQPADKLLGVVQRHAATSQAPYLSFRPVVDGHTRFSDYEERAKAGNFAKLPAIIGTVSDEGTALVPYNTDGINVEKAEQITKRFFLGPSAAMARTRSRHAPTFRYVFKDCAPPGLSSFPNISPRPWQRAYHSSDIPLVFGTHSWARGSSTDLEERVSHVWQELYVRFAEEGPEGLRKVGWKDLSSGEGIIIGRGEKGWESVSLTEIDD